MKKVYKAHILFTKEKDKFEVYENGYIAVENGRVTGVSTDLSALDSEGAEVTDFGNCLLIPAMNDMHVHAPQVHNQGVAMDLELLPWLQQYTFPEEAKYATCGMLSVCTAASCIPSGSSARCARASSAPSIRRVRVC